ncbi:hypothetical protein Tco_0981088 [Tanacetum coccineum]
MAQENYVDGCSMQRPHLHGFWFWKARFEIYVKSKYIDLWQVIQNGDFYFEVADSETKMMKETPYKILKDEQKKKLGKNNEAKMTLYNALPRKEYELIFSLKNTRSSQSPMKKLLISGFTRFNAIVTSLKSLDLDYSSKNHVRKCLHALSLKWRAKILKLKSLGNKLVTSDSQGGSDEDIDEEEEAKAFNLMARNFRKFFSKGNRFRRDNQFDNAANRFGKGHRNSFGNKGGESSRQKGVCYNCEVEGHFASSWYVSWKKTKEYTKN